MNAAENYINSFGVWGACRLPNLMASRPRKAFGITTTSSPERWELPFGLVRMFGLFGLASRLVLLGDVSFGGSLC